MRSRRIRVDLLSYESKTTGKRQQNDSRAKKNLDGIEVQIRYKEVRGGPLASEADWLCTGKYCTLSAGKSSRAIIQKVDLLKQVHA